MMIVVKEFLPPLPTTSFVFLVFVEIIIFVLTVSGIKVSSNIVINGPDSIYPCPNSFRLMVANSTSSVESDVRTVRMYTSKARFNDIEDLRYIQEFRMTSDINEISLDCRLSDLFNLLDTFTCFVFVAQNRETLAISEISRPWCIPTVNNDSFGNGQKNYDTSNKSSIDELIFSTTNSTLHDTNVNEMLYGLSRQMETSNVEISNESSSFANKKQIIALRNRFSHSLLIMCPCTQIIPLPSTSTKSESHTSTMPNIRVSTMTATLVTPACKQNESTSLVNVTSVTTNMNGSSRGAVIRDSLSHKPLLLACLIDMSELPLFHQEKDKISFSSLPSTYRKLRVKSLLPKRDGNDNNDDSSTNAIRIRDGSLSIDPLIPIDSIDYVPVTSPMLRVEFQGEHVLLLEWASDGEDNVYLDILYYVLTAISVTCLITCAIFTIVCLSLTRKGPKIQFMGISPTSEHRRASSLSQFDLADANSLEMDYYDYQLEPLTQQKDQSDDNTATKSKERDEQEQQDEETKIKVDKEEENIATDTV